MNRNILYLLSALFLAFIIGCGPSNIVPQAVNVPVGTFSGQFTYLHQHAKTGVIDTLTANVQVQLEQSAGFKVTGDTSTVVAGSYGSYLINSSNTALDFMDKTYPTTGTPIKAHLNGIYAFSYDGSNLHMISFATDTISYYYILKRTGN